MTSPDRSATQAPFALRRIALLCAMLISGGLMLFPREPMLLLIIVLCVIITRGQLPALRHTKQVLWLLLAVLLVTLLRPGPVSITSLISRFTYYLAAILLLQVYLLSPAGTLARDLRALLQPMAWQAIATVILAHTVGGLFTPLAIGRQQYLTLLGIFNYHVTIEDLTLLIRPDGFFYEPGVFQIYLNLYVYLALFVFRQPLQVLLAVLAVLCTQSTTGMLICLIMLSAAWGHHLFDASTLRRKLMGAALALALAPPMLYLGYDNIYDKLYGTAQGSSWAREYDLFTGLNIMAEYPWMGIGFEVERYLEESGRVGFEDSQLSDTLLAERPTSNGLVQLFYSLGIPLGLVFAYGAVRQRLFRHRVLIALWLGLSMFGEALLFTPFFLFVIFSGFVVPPTTRRARPAREPSGRPSGRRPPAALRAPESAP